ncbi:hypothetical protein T439DRAFT_48756 [Meredithblackwellia eburnea MCA 4105]
MILFGVVVNTFWSYLASPLYPRDSVRTKIFVWTVVILDALATAINAWEIYHYGTWQDRTAAALYMVTPTDCLPPIVVGMVAALVQTYLARRAGRMFLQRRVLKTIFLCVIGVMILVAWVASIGSGIMNLEFTWGTWEEALPFTYNNVTGTWLWISAGIDVIITVSLSWTLRKHIAGFNQNTDSMLRRLIRLGMQTAAYTSVFEVCGALFAVVFPPANIATVNVLFAFAFPLSSLYTLSLLATLSSRGEHERNPGVVQKFAGEWTLPGQSMVSAIRNQRGVSMSKRGSIMVSRELVSVTEVDLESQSTATTNASPVKRWSPLGGVKEEEDALKRPDNAYLWS